MRPHECCGCRRTGALPSRRSVLGTLACAAAAAPFVATTAAAQFTLDDERFMRMAIEQARIADFPFGAVIVKDGKVLARGRNMGRTYGDPTAHGEMVAIRRFLDQYPPTMMHGATLYTSGEPCAMCMGAILWCRFGRLVFAASVAQLATKIDQIMLSAADVAATAKFAPISITGGVLANEAMALFK
jgi:tRNA(Arg) A34 adenosine deaminase TadA